MNSNVADPDLLAWLMSHRPQYIITSSVALQIDFCQKSQENLATNQQPASQSGKGKCIIQRNTNYKPALAASDTYTCIPCITVDTAEAGL